MKLTIRILRLASVFITCSCNKFAQHADGSADEEQNSLKIQWWKDAKFGMFIHWGVSPSAMKFLVDQPHAQVRELLANNSLKRFRIKLI